MNIYCTITFYNLLHDQWVKFKQIIKQHWISKQLKDLHFLKRDSENTQTDVRVKLVTLTLRPPPDSYVIFK